MKTRIIRINGKNPSFVDNFKQDKKKKFKRVFYSCKKISNEIKDICPCNNNSILLPTGERIRLCGIFLKESEKCEFRGKVYFKIQQDFLHSSPSSPPSSPSTSSSSSSSSSTREF